MTANPPGTELKTARLARLAPGSWRVDPAHSRASFAARVAGWQLRGDLPLTGEVRIAEPIEHSTARLAALASEVSTGSPMLDRLLAGPGYLNSAAFPRITFRSELLARVPPGWRAVGRLQVKDTEHELACQLDLDLPEPGRGGPPRLVIASSWAIDSRWITSQRIPALGRRIVMTCSFRLEPDS